MSLELNLNFPDAKHVIISLIEAEKRTNSPLYTFTPPFSSNGEEHLRWYLEEYATQYSADIDFDTAKKIAAQLPVLGKALFNRIFSKRVAKQLFKKFNTAQNESKILTITAAHSEILSLPWELLYYPNKTKQFLIDLDEPISIRRQMQNSDFPQTNITKHQLHILFVISRPKTKEKISHFYADVNAVIESVEACIVGQVSMEFLRPANIEHLQQRLENPNLPHIDILHFNGQHIFDETGEFENQIKSNFSFLPENLQREINTIQLGKNTGYLSFGNGHNKENQLVPAQLFANLLNRHQISLLVLSNCQADSRKASIDNVAAQLAATGLPYVLVMRYSMMIPATKQLFSHFYQALLAGNSVGTSLDKARYSLYEKTERLEIASIEEPIKIHLYDWFLPVLYQQMQDLPLLIPANNENCQNNIILHNLPKQVAFFGRQDELNEIEHQFTQDARRITLHGAEGQGKTCLAQEAGRWLHRTGLFQCVIFIDFARYPGVDPISVVISTISSVLNKQLLNVDAVTKALKRIPTLLIFDNVDLLASQVIATPAPANNINQESVPQPENKLFTQENLKGIKNKSSQVDKATELAEVKAMDTLSKLLKAAKKWSEAGQTRLIIISQQPIQHLGFANRRGMRHYAMSLNGLDADSALEHFDSLMRNSHLEHKPTKREVKSLLKQVNHHPLSIILLVGQLRTNNLGSVIACLNTVPTMPYDALPEDKVLLALLNLATERLHLNQLYPSRMSLFYGGAFGNMLQSVSDIPATQWETAIQMLENSALLQAENLPNLTVAYYRIHPRIAAFLRTRLSATELQVLNDRYQQAYYELAQFLYNGENSTPIQIRMIQQQELPNLLYAAYGALETGKPWANEFIGYVYAFLNDFGIRSDLDQVAIQEKLQKTPEELQTWLSAQLAQGDQLYNTSQYQAAQDVFEEMLDELEDKPGHQRCAVSGRMGRCFAEQRQFEAAAEYFQQNLAELGKLEASPEVYQEMGDMHLYLATVLKEIKDYAGAKTNYEAALSVMQAVDDSESQAVIYQQLAQIAVINNNLSEAEQHYKNALNLFKQLENKSSEADVWYEMGQIYQQAQQWDSAVQAYSQAANFREEQGQTAPAIAAWNQLAQLNHALGHSQEAERCYHKAIEGSKSLQDWLNVSKELRNLAELLCTQNRLAEAFQLAETALSIDKNLNSSEAEIWQTYTLLAKIAEKQNNTLQAQTFHNLARQSKIEVVDDKKELESHQQLIDAVVQTVMQPRLKSQLDVMLKQREGKGWNKLAVAIRKIVKGERDWDRICNEVDLDVTDAMITRKILEKV